MSASLANAPLEIRAIGLPLERIEGHAKVTGTAPYAYEQALADPLYLYPVQATIARGRIASIDVDAAKALDGVIAVITHENAPRLASDENKELWVLQSDQIGFRGQFIGAVLAEHPEIALQAASLVRVRYAEQPHDVGLRADRDDLYAPETGERRLSDRHGGRRRRCGAAIRRGHDRPHLYHADGTQQPDGDAHHRRHLEG